MATVSALDALLAGPRLVGRRPIAVLSWVLLQLVSGVLTAVTLVAWAGKPLTRLRAGATPASQALTAIGQILPAYVVVFLLATGFSAINAAAVNRAVLRPDENRVAFLQLGRDELRQFALFAIYGIAAVAFYLIAAVFVGLALSTLRLPTGSERAGLVGWAVIGIVSGLALTFGLLGARLGLASAHTFDVGRVDPLGSWAITRGQFWKLLVVTIVVMALFGLTLGAATLLSSAVRWATDPGRHAFSLAGTADMSSLAAYFTPAMAARLAIFAIADALVWPLMMAPYAAIYRRLAPFHGVPGATGETIAELFT